MPAEIADGYKRRLEGEGLDKIYLFMASGLDYGTSHYYRVQTSQILIEFDNAIDNGNHIHSMCATTVTTSATTCCSITTRRSARPATIWPPGSAVLGPR